MGILIKDRAKADVTSDEARNTLKSAALAILAAENTKAPAAES